MANNQRPFHLPYTVPKEIDFPRYNMKCSGENVILSGIFHVVSCFHLHFMLYRGNLDFFSDSVGIRVKLAWIRNQRNWEKNIVSIFSKSNKTCSRYPLYCTKFETPVPATFKIVSTWMDDHSSVEVSAVVKNTVHKIPMNWEIGPPIHSPRANKNLITGNMLNFHTKNRPTQLQCSALLKSRACLYSSVAEPELIFLLVGAGSRSRTF